MMLFVSAVVNKAVIIPASFTVARMQSSISADPIHSVKHGLNIPGRIAASARGLFDSKLSY